MAGKYINLYVVIGGVCFAAATLGSATTCEDKVLCQLYGRAVCDDDQFDLWSTLNCPRFCGKCPTGVPTPPIGIGNIIDAGAQCQDAITDCARYGDGICKDVKFFTWVNDNCRLSCKRCTNRCEDKIDNCGEFARDNGGDTLCTDLQYYNWVQLNCRKYCARCT